MPRSWPVAYPHLPRTQKMNLPTYKKLSITRGMQMWFTGHY